MRKILWLLIALFVPFFKGNAQFKSGNLALLQADSSHFNTTCRVIEINKTSASQSPITTFNIPGTGSNALRFSGSATTTGYLSRSNDGTLLVFNGVNTTNFSANVNSLNPRAVGTLSSNQTFNIATTYTGLTGNQTRSSTTLNNINWFISDQSGIFTNNSTSASPSGNFRSKKSFGVQFM